MTASIMIDLNINELKKEQRTKFKSLLNALLSDKSDFYSRQNQLIEKIEFSPEFKKAKTILLYYPLADEFDLSSMIISNPDKRWVLPRAIGKSRMLLFEAGDLFHLVDSKYGTKAPPATNKLVKYNELDLVIVPALAFKEDGYRLGRGGGYYDRLLSLLPKKCKSIGVCFSELVMDEVPVDKHDVAVKKLLSV